MDTCYLNTVDTTWCKWVRANMCVLITGTVSGSSKYSPIQQVVICSRLYALICVLCAVVTKYCRSVVVHLESTVSNHLEVHTY